MTRFVVRNKFLVQASGCSTVVECMPHDKEVVGSNSAGYWAFFIFSIPSVVRP